MDVLKTKESLKMDFQNLLSCIECHVEEKNLEVIKESLKTIVDICAEEKLGKDAFREVNGLDFLINFLLNTDEILILEYCLNVLAFIVDGNVQNQIHLTNEEIFKILQSIFEKKTYPVKVLKNAIVLFSTILFQNRSAQDLVYNNGGLLSLMNLYKLFLPVSNNCFSSEDFDSLNIWLDVNRSLCFAVNNPLNQKNQELCSSLFPTTLKLIEISLNSEIIEASSLFLSLSIAGNIKNQDTFAELDGFLILKRLICKTFEQIQMYMNECNNVIRKETLLHVNCLLSIISDGVLDHERNAALCGKIGIVSLLIDFLATEVLNISIVKKILLALGYCIDACKENKLIILDVSHFDALLKRNLESDDPELHSAARYLLQVCLDIPVMNQKENICSDSESTKTDFELNFMMEENSVQSKSEVESVVSFYSNEWKNMTNHSGNDNLKKILHLPKFLTTFQERNNLGDCVDFKQKHKLFSDKKDCNQDLFLLKSKNSKCNSESELSLQSAGHFNRVQKMKFKGRQSESKPYLEEFKQRKKGKFSTSAKKRHFKSFKKNYDLDVKNITKVPKMIENIPEIISSKYEIPKCKNTSISEYDGKQKRPFTGSNDKVTKCVKKSKSGESCSSQFSFKLINGTSKGLLHSSHKKVSNNINLHEPGKIHFKNKETDNSSLKIMENTKNNKYGLEKKLGNSHSDTHKRVETILTNASSSSIFNESVVATQQKLSSNPNTIIEKAVINTDSHFEETRKLSDGFDSCKIQHVLGPFSNVSKGISKKSESYSHLAPGCLEVIVLPGTVCCEHKLASLIESLKICSIEND